MRLQINSTDRLGISQEILAIFAQRLWNIKAVEVESGCTYVQLSQSVSLDTVQQALAEVEGVISCQIIDLLPRERQANHLATLLAKIPEPLFDVDRQGVIKALNQAAKDLTLSTRRLQVGDSITRLFNLPLEQLLTGEVQTIEISVLDQCFIAEITPVVLHAQSSGAVISLRSMQHIGRQISMLQQHSTGAQSFADIIGQTPVMKELKQQAERFAQLDLPVLLQGETGTGKEMFARALHQASNRAHAPFLAINCAALPENLLESELFGYAAGAFTGAKKSGKPGLFELANGGTVFLDEIAEMSPYLQAKLLRFLQDFSYHRLGGDKELHANVRIISATHQNLQQQVINKQFREDLYYRINVLALTMPALRARVDDIKLLAPHFIQQAIEQTGQSGIVLTTTLLQQLMNYAWPGNIRQLQNTLFRLVAMSNSMKEAEAILPSILAKEPSTTNESNSQNWQQVVSWQQAQQAFEQTLLQQLYPLYPSTRALAQRLKVSHNKIAMKLRQYKISARANHQ